MGRKGKGLQMDRFMLFFWGAFAVIGLFCVVLGCALGLPKVIGSGRGETTGTVLAVSSRRTQVAYTVDGMTYRSWFQGHSSNYFQGKEIPIRYDLEDPSVIEGKDMDILYFIPCMPGLVFLVMGGIGLGIAVSKQRLESRLRKTGRRVYAEYVETRVNYMLQINSRHPYEVVCQWRNPEDGKLYMLKSKNLWTDPDFAIGQKGIRQFPVYMNPQDPRQYVVDVDMLQQDVVDLT